MQGYIVCYVLGFGKVMTVCNKYASIGVPAKQTGSGERQVDRSSLGTPLEVLICKTENQSDLTNNDLVSLSIYSQGVWYACCNSAMYFES